MIREVLAETEDRMTKSVDALEEDLKGSLSPGKLADITVLSKDIFTVPEEEILEAEVSYTIIGGAIEYRGAR